jgi:hypothetical protein
MDVPAWGWIVICATRGEHLSLHELITHKKFLSVRQEGSRQVQRNLDFYNLESLKGIQKKIAEKPKDLNER